MTMTAWADQRSPALAIVARGDQIEAKNPTDYVVRSQGRPDVSYRVASLRGRWSCECAFHTENKTACIHILAVRFRAGFRDRTSEPEAPACDRCGSGDVIAFGSRRNKSGIVRRYSCKSCGRRFTGREGFRNRRADPEKIALALDLYFRGMSFRKIAEHFRQVHALPISAATVYKWVSHYSRIAADWMDRQGASTGARWHVDETVVNINGQNQYLWNVLDGETRYLLATHVSRTRDMPDTRAPIHKAKQHTGDRPIEVVTDGMKAYPRAIRRELGRGGRNPHRRAGGITAAYNNNLVERLHSTEKERIKTMRAFDNPAGAAVLAEGWRVHYNMVRDHQAIGKTPAEAAGQPKIDSFRWAEILRRATKPVKPGATVTLVAKRAAAMSKLGDDSS